MEKDMNTKKKLLMALICFVILVGVIFIYYKMCVSPLQREAESTFESKWQMPSTGQKIVVENLPEAAEATGGGGAPSILLDMHSTSNLLSSASSLRSGNLLSYGQGYSPSYTVIRKHDENAYGNAGGGGGIIAMSGSYGGGRGSSSSYGGAAGISMSGGSPMTKPFGAPTADGQILVNPWSDPLSANDQIVSVGDGMYISTLLALLYVLLKTRQNTSRPTHQMSP